MTHRGSTGIAVAPASIARVIAAASQASSVEAVLALCVPVCVRAPAPFSLSPRFVRRGTFVGPTSVATCVQLSFERAWLGVSRMPWSGRLCLGETGRTRV